MRRTSPAELAELPASFWDEAEVVTPTTGRVTPDQFLGAWRIETMELWAKDAIELLGPGMFVFEDEAFGEFRFIAVRGWMDCRFGVRDGRPLVEFSWQGKDERDDACGRGWAVIEADGALAGRIYIHQGDDSAFAATRADGGRPAEGVVLADFAVSIWTFTPERE